MDAPIGLPAESWTYAFTKLLEMIIARILGTSFLLILLALVASRLGSRTELPAEQFAESTLAEPKPLPWSGRDSSQIPHTREGELIRYGRLLIAFTADYIGPGGILSRRGNGMNCQNCHLEAGTKAWANNYGGVYSTYPKFRERRGALESVYQRVNDCFQRSLNSQPLDSLSREMQAILAYLRWIGAGVPRGVKPLGSGIPTLTWLNRPADPELGKALYAGNCQRCHGAEGQGLPYPVQAHAGYLYPPLWGPKSYTTGAGLYRLSRFAGYIRFNMPQGASFDHPLLSDEQAWDLAAFVNSQPRPVRVFPADWPDISLKPVDHPFGPYSDHFSERQHKFGPFGPIQKAKTGKKE
jgi:thiosulfate dehydrogenase